MYNNSNTMDTPLTSRIRPNSAGSADSDVSTNNKQPRRYDNFLLDEMLAIIIDTEIFENTRTFNPRKQRSCHKRAEPVSEERRKEESSKNSREYTKRNRDEIKVCQLMYIDISAIHKRLSELVSDLKWEKQEAQVLSAVHCFEKILHEYFDEGTDFRKMIVVSNVEEFLPDYRKNATLAASINFISTIDSYEQKYAELSKELALLENKKDNLVSQKDKTNYASSKSRLKQRVLRADLKTKCWKCWMEIETLKLRGAALKKCSQDLKKDVWENILSKLYMFVKSLKAKQLDTAKVRQIDRIVSFFEPFSSAGAETQCETSTPNFKTLEPRFTSPEDTFPCPMASNEKQMKSLIQDSDVSSTFLLPSFSPSSYLSSSSTVVSPTFATTIPGVAINAFNLPQTVEPVKKASTQPIATTSSEETSSKPIWTNILDNNAIFSDVKEQKPIYSSDYANHGTEEEIDIMSVNEDTASENNERETFSSRKRSGSPSDYKTEAKRNNSPALESPSSIQEFPFAWSMNPLVQYNLFTLLLTNPAMIPFLPPQYYSQFIDFITTMKNNMTPRGQDILNNQLQISNQLAALTKIENNPLGTQ
uniref:Uncharacterized protein n=1 Tax=Caenorhabditis japonica TaxID=281687 RepID=A0A8R1DKV0_CAEJA